MNRTTIIALQQYLKEKIKLNDSVNEYVDIKFPSNLTNMTGQSLKNKLEIFDKIVTGSQKINGCDYNQRNLVYCWVVSTVNGQKEIHIGSSYSSKRALLILVTYYKRFQLVWDRQKKAKDTFFSEE